LAVQLAVAKLGLDGWEMVRPLTGGPMNAEPFLLSRTDLLALDGDTRIEALAARPALG
jgi:hypothetical protein